MVKTVGETSEDELLHAFLPIITAHNRGARRLELGPGDDCAVLDLSGGLTVASTDTQTENRDFRHTWPNGFNTGGYEVGWKTATQNLADVAAMGAVPVSLLISLTLTPDTPVHWVSDFARGVTASCTAQGASTCTISGGDLGAGNEISVTVTALGTCTVPVVRSGAKPGDAVVLAGSIGTAAAGLALLETASGYTVTPALARCIEAQQKPRSPLTAAVAAAPQLHAMLDVSDGLLRDLGRIARASQVSINLDGAALEPWLKPLGEAATICAQPGTTPDELAQHWVLTGGEDHGLLATCPIDAIPEGFSRIGTVTAESTCPTVTVDGATYGQKGWDHFETPTR
ncbi:MAG: thiamine-phosphate kinase [Rothia sp. (in: high G+C Gram-positive bacteria)]|nr:thiamine-phosphate kinase [Rothia sp. (in: high G+C Gram-positive bacteria)]